MEISKKLKSLVEERDRHNQELAGLQELVTQKVSRINYLNGGIASLMDLMDDSEKAQFEEEYKKSFQSQLQPESKDEQQTY